MSLLSATLSLRRRREATRVIGVPASFPLLLSDMDPCTPEGNAVGGQVHVPSIMALLD